MDRMAALEEEWRVHCAGNFEELQWRGPDSSGRGWEVTLLGSLSSEVPDIRGDSSWPGLTTEVDGRCSD
jgi:hypothetical protein